MRRICLCGLWIMQIVICVYSLTYIFNNCVHVTIICLWSVQYVNNKELDLFVPPASIYLHSIKLNWIYTRDHVQVFVLVKTYPVRWVANYMKWISFNAFEIHLTHLRSYAYSKGYIKIKHLRLITLHAKKWSNKTSDIKR